MKRFLQAKVVLLQRDVASQAVRWQPHQCLPCDCSTGLGTAWSSKALADAIKTFFEHNHSYQRTHQTADGLKGSLLCTRASVPEYLKEALLVKLSSSIRVCVAGVVHTSDWNFDSPRSMPRHKQNTSVRSFQELIELKQVCRSVRAWQKTMSLQFTEQQLQAWQQLQGSCSYGC
jgi:hypothetical protein